MNRSHGVQRFLNNSCMSMGHLQGSPWESRAVYSNPLRSNTLEALFGESGQKEDLAALFSNQGSLFQLASQFSLTYGPVLLSAVAKWRLSLVLAGIKPKAGRGQFFGAVCACILHARSMFGQPCLSTPEFETGSCNALASLLSVFYNVRHATWISGSHC